MARFLAVIWPESDRDLAGLRLRPNLDRILIGLRLKSNQFVVTSGRGAVGHNLTRFQSQFDWNLGTIHLNYSRNPTDL